MEAVEGKESIAEELRLLYTPEQLAGVFREMAPELSLFVCEYDKAAEALCEEYDGDKELTEEDADLFVDTIGKHEVNAMAFESIEDLKTHLREEIPEAAVEALNFDPVLREILDLLESTNKDLGLSDWLRLKNAVVTFLKTV
ncbi:hypothetical protein DRO27_05470 [Candidatus Bathyarchaeota archaeon]|nr:MAG: hypothetical protein DRO27_05470 [Candidatus Bathyarchaeota archaeon]